MVISISDNWASAKTEHAAYVKRRVDNFEEHYRTQQQVDHIIVKFLREITAKLKKDELEASARSLPSFLQTLDSLPDLKTRKEFEKGITSNSTDIGVKTRLGVGLAAARSFRKKHSSTGLTEFYKILGGYAVSDCSENTTKQFYRHLALAVLPTRKKSKDYDFLRDTITPYIEQLGTRRSANRCTFHFLQESCNGIGIAEFSELQATIPAFLKFRSKVRRNPLHLKMFLGNIEEIFDYESFISTKEGKWNAYELCKRSKSRTCPYCNQAYAFTIYRKDGSIGFRPTLDHFLPKKKFPYLALSINNLIPSCYTCNSNLKGQIDFSKIPHLNPLYDEPSFKFSIDLQGYTKEQLLNNFDAVKRVAKLTLIFDNADRATANSASTFMIEERYQPHIDEAVEFIALRLSLDSGRSEEISRLLGRTEAQLLRFDRTRYRNFLLGKMYADLFDAFKR